MSPLLQLVRVHARPYIHPITFDAVVGVCLCVWNYTSVSCLILQYGNVLTCSVPPCDIVCGDDDAGGMTPITEWIFFSPFTTCYYLSASHTVSFQPQVRKDPNNTLLLQVVKVQWVGALPQEPELLFDLTNPNVIGALGIV